MNNNDSTLPSAAVEPDEATPAQRIAISEIRWLRWQIRDAADFGASLDSAGDFGAWERELSSRLMVIAILPDPVGNLRVLGASLRQEAQDIEDRSYPIERGALPRFRWCRMMATSIDRQMMMLRERLAQHEIDEAWRECEGKA